MLFPYAYENVANFLAAHRNDPHIKEVVRSLCELSNEEAQVDADIQRCPDSSDACLAVIVSNVRTWIKKDKKVYLW